MEFSKGDSFILKGKEAKVIDILGEGGRKGKYT